MAEKSNFLSRLAGRTLGLEPTVQPIIAPMYAPGQQLTETEDALSVTPNEQAGHEQRRGPAVSRQERPLRQVINPIEQAFPLLIPQESRTAMPLHRAEGPGVQTVSAHSIAIETSTAGFSPGTLPEVLHVSKTDATQMKDRSLPVSRQSERDADLMPRQTMDALDSGEEDARAAASLRQDSTLVITTHRTSPGPVVDVRGQADQSAPEVIDRSLRSARMDREPADIPGVRESARSKVIGSQQNGQEIAAPPPTIQVTIGRIEVRATPPSLPPSQPRSGPHIMGLDEYLNQRSRGGR